MSHQYHEAFDAGIAPQHTPSIDGNDVTFITASLDEVRSTFHQPDGDLSRLGFKNISFVGDRHQGHLESRCEHHDEVDPAIVFKFRNTEYDEPHRGFPRGRFEPEREHGRSLEDALSDYLQQDLPPGQRAELAREQRQFERDTRRWSMGSSLDSSPPDLREYPLLNQHMRRVHHAEETIYNKVMRSLTPEEWRALKRENNPLGSGFAPRPMNEEVSKRLRRATHQYVQDSETHRRNPRFEPLDY